MVGCDGSQDTPFQVHFEIEPTMHTLEPGRQLMLYMANNICSGNAPPLTGEPPLEQSAWSTASFEVLTGPDYPSRITVPTIQADPKVWTDAR